MHSKLRSGLNAALVAAFLMGLSGCAAETGEEPIASESEALTYTGILFMNQQLNANDSLTSFTDPLVYLKMQGDCNLVLTSHGRVLWHSRTAGRGTNCRAKMQGDGNFVVSNQNGPVWWSGSQGHPYSDLWLDTAGTTRLFVKGPNYWKFIYPRD